jgi:hypothetical protein|tara:strand:+ start:596 stop:793 length:198 start_codon:yes stop_codon:yes gene_type:complete
MNKEKLEELCGKIPLHILEGEHSTLRKWIYERTNFTGVLFIKHPITKLIKIIGVGAEEEKNENKN